MPEISTTPVADGWSGVAGEWAALWGTFPAPVHEAIIEHVHIGSGTAVLDVGCGSGEFLRMLEQRGAVAEGVDPAPGMVALAGPHAREADFDHLPWPDHTFDVVTAINALQFADDTLGALAEATRVTKRGGFVAIANWAESSRNDLDVIERAVAEHYGEVPSPGGDLRDEGGLERLFGHAGLVVTASRLIALAWVAKDDDTLVRGVLLGEDEHTMAELAPVVLAAAQHFATDEGYRLMNAFRLVVGQVH